MNKKLRLRHFLTKKILAMENLKVDNFFGNNEENIDNMNQEKNIDMQ